MTHKLDLDSLLTAYMVDGMQQLPDRVADAVLDEVHRTRQRAAFGPWRTPSMSNPIKFVLAAAAVIVVVLAGFNLAPRDERGIGVPGSVTPPAEASPSATARSQKDRFDVAGTETTRPMTARIQLPDGWENDGWFATGPEGETIMFTLVANTFSDPCGHRPRNPAVFQSLDAVAAALTQIPVTTATGMGSRISKPPYRPVDMTIPEILPCPAEQFWLWLDSPQHHVVPTATPQTLRIRVFEAAGQIVAVTARINSGTSQATRDAIDAAMETVRFEGVPPPAGVNP